MHGKLTNEQWRKLREAADYVDDMMSDDEHDIFFEWKDKEKVDEKEI